MPNVGIISIIVSVYCSSLCLIQLTLKHEASKLLMTEAYGSMSLMTLASVAVSLTYYSPRLGSSQCFCHEFWAIALVCYVASLYLLKAMYVTRIHLIGKGTILGTKATAQGVRIVTVSLCICALVCLSMCISMTDGTCYANQDQYGCLPTFYLADVYVALIMIMFDSILFGAFCFKWNKVISIFKMASNDASTQQKIVKQFTVQCIITITAMLSCFLDGIIQVIIYDSTGSNYDIVMIIFLIDCAIVVTCNFLLITESQTIAKKCACFFCIYKIQFVERGQEPSKISVPSKSKNSVTELSKGSTTNTASTAIPQSRTNTADTIPTNNTQMEINSSNSDMIASNHLSITPSNSQPVQKSNSPPQLAEIKEEVIVVYDEQNK